MYFMDKFIKQFFIVFAVMLMLGSGFLANADNLLFLQKVEASEVRDISNLSTAEKTAVYVYRTISGFFSSAEKTVDSQKSIADSTDEVDSQKSIVDSTDEDDSSLFVSDSEADRGEISENVPSVPAT